MTRLLWDNVGDRRYETGVDRGVLYLSDGTGVPWNGLTSVEEDLTDTKTTPYYLDGVKYLDSVAISDFSGVLNAFTYPDEFMEFDGITSLVNGLFGTAQVVKETFGLSYRTKVGNDIDGIDHGYKIHLVYNLTATPSNKKFSSINASLTPDEFSWNIVGVPVQVDGFKPTSHFIIDSSYFNSYQLSMLENLLYGNDNQDPRLPPLSYLINFINDFSITDDGFIEDQNDPGTYIIENNAAIEDPNDPGTYIIEHVSIVEDPNDPGTYLDGVLL